MKLKVGKTFFLSLQCMYNIQCSFFLTVFYTYEITYFKV